MTSIHTEYENNLVINRVDESTTMEDISQHIYKSIDNWIDKNVIWDLRTFQFSDISSENIHNFLKKIQKLSQTRSGLKTAIIVESGLGYGMIRMLEMIAQMNFKFTIGVYRSMEEAKGWLIL